MTSLACVLGAPINLVRWGQVAQLANLANARGGVCAFSKSDDEAVYKQIPIEADRAILAVAASLSPVDNRRYGFISRTIVFGAVSAVLHYNVFPRHISEIFTRLFGPPPHPVFFDDFGDISPLEVSEAALRTSALFCSKMGI